MSSGASIFNWQLCILSPELLELCILSPELLELCILSPELLEDARKVVAFALEEINAEMRCDAEEVKTAVRQALRRFCKKTIERRPVILPVILEM